MDVQKGDKVIYTGEEEPKQNDVFVIGKEYEVEDTDGLCFLGEGLSIVDSLFCMVNGNYKKVEE